VAVSPLLIFLVVLLLVFGGAAWAFHTEIKRAGGIKFWLADLPTTNVRIAVSVLLSVFFVVISMLATVLAVMNPAEVRQLPDDVLDTIALFLLGMMGIDAAAYIAKRITHRDPSGDAAPPGATQEMPAGASRVTVATQGGPSQTTVTTQPAPIPMEGQ